MIEQTALNDRQKEAVLHLEGPLLIVAGAGAGKTKTITHRIAHLIESGVPVHRILAVTFTNKAAGEMRDRVRALIPSGRGVPFVSTFHSLGVRLLREFSKEAGVPRGFSIWDRDDSIRALKRILEKNDESMQPRQALSRISREKGEGRSVAEFAGLAKNFREQAVAKAWLEYEQVLRDEGALDFDDLLFRTVEMLRNSTPVRELLQDRWHYVTIDEYQDTNSAQYELASTLAAPQNNLCVVGDTDQNIYSWRGADIAHLMGFEKAFANTKVVKLEQNYRSTGTIISAANGVIAKNENRTPKLLFTENPVGDAIMLYGAQNELDEAWFIAAKAGELIANGTNPRNIAVLYRENFQSRALEEAFLHTGLPYRVLGVRFFERKEVKDTLSYLRAALNPKSRNDLVRIAGVPTRGIGKTTLEKMMLGEDAALPASARAKVAAFRETLVKIGKGIEILPASEAVRYCVEESGIEKMHKADAEEGTERLDNIRELINFATRFDTLPPLQGIEQLLEEAALQSDQDQLDERQDAVSLMTVHASKGLEFDAVFITGLEQGLFPSIKLDPSADGRDPEEERRLFYVALTRARKMLCLTYAAQRSKYGSREYAVPSEFLEDIDQRLIEQVVRKRGLLDDDEDIVRY